MKVNRKDDIPYIVENKNMFETTNQVRDWPAITADTVFFGIIHHNPPTQQGQIWESYPNPSALNARFSYNYLHWIAYHIYPYIRSMKGLSQWIRHPWFYICFMYKNGSYFSVPRMRLRGSPEWLWLGKLLDIIG
jgi:hypothetical protein